MHGKYKILTLGVGVFHFYKVVVGLANPYAHSECSRNSWDQCGVIVGELFLFSESDSGIRNGEGEGEVAERGMPTPGRES